MEFRHNSRLYLQRQKIQQDQRGNITVGATGEISLMGEKNALQRKKSIKRRHITRKDFRAAKRSANGG